MTKELSIGKSNLFLFLSLNVSFRNIKPENFLFTSDSNDADIKLVHFTHAVEIANRRLTEPCGTSGYFSPEMIREEPYGKPVDMWSFGVVLFIILSGTAPYYDPNPTRLFQMILNDRVSFDEDYWSEVSPQAKDLIRRLLEKDAAKRLTVDQALHHPWFSLSDEVLERKHLRLSTDFASKRSSLATSMILK
jgi:calcium/calmodulin-dependent protein kinase I